MLLSLLLFRLTAWLTGPALILEKGMLREFFSWFQFTFIMEVYLMTYGLWITSQNRVGLFFKLTCQVNGR